MDTTLQKYIQKRESGNVLVVPVKGNMSGGYSVDLNVSEQTVLDRLLDDKLVSLSFVSHAGAVYTKCESTLIQVPLWRLIQRSNYRQEYDTEFVNKLASDMATNGFKVEYPIVTYAEDDKFVVIDGNTRYTAARLASGYDRKDHKATLMVWIVVKPKPSDSEFILNQLAANELRRDPDDISKAKGYQTALDSGASLVQVAENTGHKVDYIERRVKLLKLAPDLQPLVAKGQLPLLYANAITVLDSNRQRIAVQAYNRSKTSNLESFVENVVNPLLEQQVKESEQGNFFGLYSADQLEEQVNTLAAAVTSKDVKGDILAQLEAAKAEAKAEREARLKLLADARRDYARLLSLYRAVTTSPENRIYNKVNAPVSQLLSAPVETIMEGAN